MPTLTAAVLENFEDIKEYLKLTSSDADGKLREMLNAVCADAQNRFMKRALLKATYTDELHDGNGTEEIVLENWPVVSIASLTIDNHHTNPTTLTEGITNDFLWYADGRIILVRQLTYRFPQSVKCTYDAGYDGIANVPLEIRQSIREAVAHKWRVQDKKSASVTSQTLGNQSQVLIADKAYPKHVTDVWTAYRRKKHG